jgi:iron complex transport system ATP-binding protein
MRRRSIQTLSGGERQRVFLASALAQQSPVLLLDEPTSALDLEHSLRLTTILEALASEGQHAIVLATHDINLAARCCTRLVVLKQGEVVADGPPIDVLSESLMRSVFGVETAIEISQTTSTPYILPLRAAERR